MTTTPPAVQVPTAPSSGAARPAGAAAPARTALLLTALLAALAWNALSHRARPDGDALSAPPLRMPERRCGLTSDDPHELLAQGKQLAAAARARVDRYPFRPAEGLPALALLDEAAACAALAGAGADAEALRAQALAFRLRVELDYRDRVLRVERALALDEPHRARADVRVLAAQLEGEDHAFARRMRNLRSLPADGGRK